MPDSQSREPRFESPIAIVSKIGHFLSLHWRPCWLSCIYIIREEPLSLLHKGSRSRRLWESPPVPSERYERGPCLCVFVARFDRRIFLLFIKNGFVVGVRTLNVTAGHWKSICYWGDPAIVSLPRLDRRDTMGLLSSARQPHTRCALSCTAAGRGEGGRGGRDGTGVEGRGGDGKGGDGRGGEGREGRWRQGANFTGGILMRELASIQYIHKPSHNAALALDTLVLQIKNSEQV